MITESKELNKLEFHIIKLIENGFSYDELTKLNYNPEIVEHCFKMRKYILVCKENREKKKNDKTE